MTLSFRCKVIDAWMDGQANGWQQLRQTHQLITGWKSLSQTHKYPYSTFSTNHWDMLDFAKCCNARHLLEPERDESCIGYHLGLVRMWEVRVRTHLAHHSRDAKRWWPQHAIVAWACLKSCLCLVATCKVLIFQLPCKVLTCAFHPNLDVLKDMFGWADHEDAEFPWNTKFCSSDGRYLKMNFKSLKAWNSDSFTGVLETKSVFRLPDGKSRFWDLSSFCYSDPHFGPAVLRNLASVLRKVSFTWSWVKLVLDNMFRKKSSAHWPHESIL